MIAKVGVVARHSQSAAPSGGALVIPARTAGRVGVIGLGHAFAPESRFRSGRKRYREFKSLITEKIKFAQLNVWSGTREAGLPIAAFAMVVPSERARPSRFRC
jgi:hypothetical protein